MCTLCDGPEKGLKMRQIAVTACPGSSHPFYVVTYYIKWVSTAWAHSTSEQNQGASLSCLYIKKKSTKKILNGNYYYQIIVIILNYGIGN